MTRPPDLRDKEEEIKRMEKQKEEAVANQDFEMAAEYRDKAEKLKRGVETTLKKWRESSKEKSGNVNEDVITEVVSGMTGIPLTKLEEKEQDRLAKMEAVLHERVVSQDEAIQAISKTVRRSRTGLKDPNRPMGSFIFVGPTGVGKTLLAKALAKFMFGEEEALVHVDMSEYMEKHAVSRLVGAPPGYVGYDEGGQLTEKIRRRPYAVILLDEIEKAHPDVFNILLQIMEEGKLTDSFGRIVDFRNVILILTSNIGAELIKRQATLGFSRKKDAKPFKELKRQLIAQVEKHFRPEFLNRLDDIIVFKNLTKDDLEGIVQIEMGFVRERLLEQDIELQMDDAALEFMITKGYNPDYGARPLKRIIAKYIEDPISEGIVNKEYRRGITLKISLKDKDDVDEGLDYKVVKPRKKAKAVKEKKEDVAD